MNNIEKLYKIALNSLKLKEFKQAKEQYLHLLELSPNFTQAWFDLAYLYLIQKDFLNGWKHYEKRLKLPSHTLQTQKFSSTSSLLNNEDISNKTLLVFSEQGFGDTIQFIRFIKSFQEKYPSTTIILQVQQSLQKLIKFNISNIKLVTSFDNLKYDYHLSLLSLAYKLNFKYHLPLKSYLTINLNNKIDLKTNKQKVGICWQGNLNNSRDKYRSIDLNIILSILPKDNIQVYSLQKDIRVNHRDIIDLGKDFDDFHDTACAIKSLDFVITVDTSIVHLAGALGIKTYLLLPFVPDWRWGENDTQSYWYDSVSILRQTVKNNWTKPLLDLKYSINKPNNKHLQNIQNALFYLDNANSNNDISSVKLAKFYFKKVIKDDFSLYEAYYNLAFLEQKEDNINKAIKLYKKALTVNKQHIQSLHNLGNIYHKICKFDKAYKLYKQILKINPNELITIESLAELYKDTKKLHKAIDYYRIVLKEAPNNFNAKTSLAITLIMNGDFKNGWEQLESRWELEDFKKLKSKYNGKLWNNESLNGKTLLVFTEQGFGDTIQFIRIINNIKDLYPKSNIIVQTQKTLKKLFSSITAIDKIIPWDIKASDYDYFIPLLSLPNRLNLELKTIPSTTPYLFPKTKRLLNKSNKLKIGIVWEGSKSDNNAIRSVKLQYFKSLSKQSNCQFYSLQIGDVEHELKQINSKIINLGKDFKNFNDTAIAIKSLDLVITVDTSVAHLSGALNIPTWVILPYQSGYLWMLDRNDSLWYPTIKLFRQDKPNKWNKVFKNIKNNLKRYIKNGKEN